MNIEVMLFGAARDLHPQPSVSLPLFDGASIADLRRALPGCLADADPQRLAALLAVSAFASDCEVLRDDDPLPVDGRVAWLPPVSGG